MNKKKDTLPESNCLILEADQENLPKNSKIYYLGYWCLENTDGSFKNLNKFNIINSKPRNVEDINHDIREVYKVYNTLILELTNFLNKYHHKNYSKNYWEIILGPWLKFFLTVVRERYNCLDTAFKKLNINEIMLPNYADEDFFIYNVEDFEDKASKNINGWNTILYTKILKILGHNKNIINFEIKKKKITKILKKNFVKILKKKIIYFVSLFNIFCKNSKYIIYECGLGFVSNIKLQLYLKQIPSILTKEEYPKKKINLNIRKQINHIFYRGEAKEYEKIVRSLISNLFPTDLLENYTTLENKFTKLKWPKNPKIIFTSTGYHSDEIFKMYTAKQIEKKKSKYIVCQHGANNFTHKNSFIELGYDCSNTFFSWGNFEKKKCVTLFNLKNVALNKNNEIVKGEKILFFMPKMSRSRKRLYDDYSQMIRDNISIEKILANLDNKIKDSCVLKLYPNENESEDLENKILNEIIFKKRKYNIERSTSKKKIFKNSKLILNYGDGTSFLETISTDTPTIIFLPNFNWIEKKAEKDYEQLLESNILFNDEKLMSNHINNIFYDINNWWNSPKTKKAKLNFEEKYSKRPPHNYLKVLSKKILSQI